ncbi:MAG: MraY family glycosyltransferase [Aerococcaceae bacterium]|nr:MraY family glycosyltransferase [Aerococcaceae bacterium]
MIIQLYLKILVSVIVLSAVLTYGLIRLAHFKQWYDKDYHDIKGRPKVPALGGVALFISFWVGIYLLLPTLGWTRWMSAVLIGSIIIVVTGLFDDAVELSPLQKSFGILLAANVIYFMGNITFSSQLLPHLAKDWFHVIAYMATMCWIYFVTNAVNLLDGLDGLASSVSLVSLVTLVGISYAFSRSLQVAMFMMMLVLIAAILGFLPYNWYRAKIYLGDTGALFIGFMYAVLTVSGLKNATFFALLVPIMLYVVPIFDTGYAMVRRLLTGKPVAQADNEHVHHRLLRLGIPETQVVWVMIGVTLLFSVLAVLTHIYPEWRAILLSVIIGLVAGLIIGMWQLAKWLNK